MMRLGFLQDLKKSHVVFVRFFYASVWFVRLGSQCSNPQAKKQKRRRTWQLVRGSPKRLAGVQGLERPIALYTKMKMIVGSGFKYLSLYMTESGKVAAYAATNGTGNDEQKPLLEQLQRIHTYPHVFCHVSTRIVYLNTNCWGYI